MLHDIFLAGLNKRNFKGCLIKLEFRVQVDADFDGCLAIM